MCGAKINLQLWMSRGLPSAARRLCIFRPQGSWRSSLNRGDGEGVTVRGWWRGSDGEGIMSAPPAPCNLPRLSSLVIPNIGNAPGSTWLAKKGSEQTAAMQESIPCYAVDFWDSKHWGRNVWRAASSLNRYLFQAGVQEGCRAPAGRRRECGDASSRNTMLPSLDSNEFYCQRETRAQMWNLRESKDWEVFLGRCKELPCLQLTKKDYFLMNSLHQLLLWWLVELKHVF